MNRATIRRRLLLAMAGGFGLLVIPAVTVAHPLGNFTINHFAGIRISTHAAQVDYVLDMAEIPTFTERSAMDTNGDGAVQDSESAAYAAAHCDATANALALAAGGQAVALQVIQRGISFPLGAGAPTLRLVCEFQGSLPAALGSGATSFTFKDTTFAERRGWREIVVQGDGATLEQSDAPTSSVSNRLMVYPQDLLATPSNQLAASWGAVAGGPALSPLSVPDASPIGASVAVGGGTEAQPQQVVPATTTTAAVPNGVTDLGSDVTALFQAKDLTPWVIAVSLLVAAGLGALHAVSPGHGKTVMAAYLVGSRGNARQALGLGLMVTVSHTIGVLTLGLLTLSFSTVIPPDRLYPILGVASGTIVVGIGTWLIWQRIADVRRTRSVARADVAHAEAHAHDLEHEHAHGSDHQHEHAHEHAHEQVASPAELHGHPHAGDAPEHPVDEGWHSHGGRSHTHLPPKGTTLSRRGLITLGLAGGMVPSVSALIVLLGALAAGRPAYGVVLTIAFGVGMASVLVGVGLGLVYARGLVERFSNGRRGLSMARWLPTATAFVVLGAGALMTVQALALR